jgi:hypothetical protein
MAAVLLACGLAACGGGGDGGGGGGGAAADQRNGDYVLFAANAQEYTLRVDLDARTWRVQGSDVDQSGSLAASGSMFQFEPSNSVGDAGTNTLRLDFGTDSAVGNFAFPQGVLPFVAARRFVTSVQAAAGTYNFLTRRLDTAAPVDTRIQQGEVTSDGHYRVCNDATIYLIAFCPSASLLEGTVTLAGTQFTASTPQGTLTFRVAEMGDDKVFLRASASGATARNFQVGMPAVDAFASGSFEGGASDGSWGTAVIGTATFALSGTTPSGATVGTAGTAAALGSNNGLGSLLGLATGSDGFYFATSSAELGMVLAARGNVTAPGFVAIGRRH